MIDIVALSHAFIDRWHRRDIDGILAALAEDIEYQNVPMAAMHGRTEVREFITPVMLKATRVEWIVHHLATIADGSKVLTERTDSFHFGSQLVAVRVMGIFEFRGELISRWRDYSDLGDFARQMSEIKE